MAQPTLNARLAVRERPTNQTPLMHQNWRNLLFLHWEYDPNAIQATLPDGLHVDTFEGKAYIGITPFFMQDVRLKGMPSMPGLSNFLEINTRTYVYDDKGVPGIWFYSLDANSFMGVQAAKNFFHLPYYYAEMRSKTTSKGAIDYECRRQGDEQSPFMRFVYKGHKESKTASQDSLEFFLVERYLLFSQDEESQLYQGRVHHAPYPISHVDVETWDEHLFELNELEKPNRAPDHLLFSSGVDVDIFNLQENA
jgi:uncharacterized protein